MMMDRRHFENALARCFEAYYLEDHGKSLADIDYCNKRKQQMLMGYKAHCAHAAPQEHGACIAHEDLCGVKVPHQKAHASACKSRGENGIFVQSH